MTTLSKTQNLLTFCCAATLTLSVTGCGNSDGADGLPSFVPQFSGGLPGTTDDSTLEPLDGSAAQQGSAVASPGTPTDALQTSQTVTEGQDVPTTISSQQESNSDTAQVTESMQPIEGAGGAGMGEPPMMENAAGASMVPETGAADESDVVDEQVPAEAPTNVEPPSAPPNGDCPANAIFCADFEGASLPPGTQFQPAYLDMGVPALGSEVFLDSTQSNSGSQSLHMPAGNNYYRMLAVPTPNSYWVRLYTRSDVGFGAPGSTHAALFMASTLDFDGDYNGDNAVEIAEQFDQVLLNVRDSLYGTSGENPNGQPGTTLPDNAWVCMEAQFDGPSGDVHVFVEGNEIIDASGWQGPKDFRSFRFGYLRFSSPTRDVWMDDVVVAPTRIG